MMLTRYKQHGVALITALLILSLAATAAIFLTNQHQLSIRRTGNVINSNQAYLYAVGAEALAMSILFKDSDQNAIDSLEDDWAEVIPPLPIEGGFVAGSIKDLQGRFNINNLLRDGRIDPASIGILERLLEQFDIDPQVAQAVADWLDEDFESSGPAGAEDDYYIGLEIPYRAANKRMSSISELFLIRGIDADKVADLAQHLTALPSVTTVNVNTASEPVLIALGLDASTAARLSRLPTLVDETGAPELDTAQDTTPYETVADFLRQASVSADTFPSGSIGVSSNYFLFEGIAEVDRGKSVLKTILQRNNDGIMRVIIRSQSDL